ncbi:MAG: PEP-CTERM sorting domain-containing protein [Pirellulales bacterium]
MLNFTGFRILRNLFVALFVLAMPPTLSPASQIFDASADFDSTSNPSGVNGGTYSYGYTPTLGGAFSLLPGTFINGPVEGYNAGPAGSSPALSKNTSNAPHDLFPGSVIHYEPQQLVLHPGGGGEYAVLRFTAPQAGNYSYDAAFSNADSLGATTDVHVLIGGVAAASDGINVGGGGSTATLSSPSVFLPAGQTLDFAVGVGNGSFVFDSTGLFASVALVPEPSTIVLLAAGIAVLAAGTVRRRLPAVR